MGHNVDDAWDMKGLTEVRMELLVETLESKKIGRS